MDIVKAIERANLLSYDLSFDYALQCSKLLTGNGSDRALARRAAIHILDRWDSVPIATRPLWTDIIEAVGFYPYISKISNTDRLDSFADEIRQQSFLSDHLPNTYMHSEQKKLSDYLSSERNVVASAPTSFGKSLLIEELVATRKHKNIVIIQPTLALLDETRIKLKKYKDDYKIIVRTSQEPAIDRGNLFLLTAERVMEYEWFTHVDLLIIDEFYKMSLKRVDDRADTLNNAFLKIYDTFKPKFYLLGPNIDGITEGFEEKYSAIFYKTDYSLVDCNVNVITGVDSEAQRERKLFELLDSQANQQTLVYCSSPQRARSVARAYLKHLRDNSISTAPKEELPIIEWLSDAIPKWSLTEKLTNGIAIHDGSLPKHLGASIIRYFNEGRIRCIFCTSTIIEGVNTSAKNVVIYDGKKGRKDIDYFDFSNIKGRSGRLMEHFLGNVYCFAPIPQTEAIIVDIPFYEQDSFALTSEVLVNIRAEDVKPQVQQRYNELNAIEPELLNIFKQNGTKIDGQQSIYARLQNDIVTRRDFIVWTQVPNYDQIRYILQLCKGNYLSFDGPVRSVEQLAVYLNQYRADGSLASIIQGCYDYSIGKVKKQTAQRQADHYDKAIEVAFHVYRHWFQFTVPKAFRIVDSLQRYVCAKRGIKAGSYSYYVQQLENDFIRNNLSILIEYGIPSQTVRRIEQEIPASLSEDDVIQFIQENRDRLFAPLMQYERDRLEQCL
ncbi:MAG: DEAD/DEAH box helicase [Oscillospiraceae bacterium]|nr:DEAD/DEAH box helicase [Oscillospiraceae bacterium]